MASPLLSAAKYLDQPVFLEKLRRAVPVMLPAAGALLVGHDTYTAPEGEKGKAFIRSLSVSVATVASALLAMRLFMRPDPGRLAQVAGSLLETRGISLTKALEKRLEKLGSVREFEALLKEHGMKVPGNLRHYAEKAAGSKGLSPSELHRFRVENLTEVLRKRDMLDDSLAGLLEKGKGVLSPKEVHRLRKAVHQLEKDPERARALLNQVIPDPKNLTGREILGEIKDLSMLGLLPVLGGLVGGVTGNVLSGENWREKFKNQAKEGFFQYFANIFLCNVGAGAFLYGLEKTPLKSSRPARFAAMMVGITAFGIVGGSAIANVFGKNLINRMIDHGPVEGMRLLSKQVREEGWASLFENLYDERRPEPLDVGLHVDDVATVGVLSGLKWIEPLLPFLYSISGWRAGIGYRNGVAATDSAADRPFELPLKESRPVLFRQSAFSGPEPPVTGERKHPQAPPRSPASYPYSQGQTWKPGYPGPLQANYFQFHYPPEPGFSRHVPSQYYGYPSQQPGTYPINY